MISRSEDYLYTFFPIPSNGRQLVVSADNLQLGEKLVGNCFFQGRIKICCEWEII